MKKQKQESKNGRELKRGRGMREGIKTGRPKKTKGEEERGEEISPEALSSYLDRQTTDESACQLYLPN